jgi:hypothetical protein
MDTKQMLTEHLYQAERHVALGEHHIERQRQIIHDLERGGHDTTAAKACLTQFEEMQLLHIRGRDRLREELAKL